MTFDFSSNKIEVFPGINDVPVKPTASKTGNGSHLINVHNSLVDLVQSALNELKTSIDVSQLSIAQISQKLTSGNTSSGGSTMPGQAILTYKSPGDDNGVFNFIGTNFGTSDFYNPVLSRNIYIASNSVNRAGVERLVDRTPDESWSTGYDDAGDWIAFNVGNACSLLINHLSFQRDGDYYFYLNEFKVQGCNSITDLSIGGIANAPWEDIASLIDEESGQARRGFQWRSFPIYGTTKGYQWIRLIVPNGNGYGNKNLQFGEIELYGTYNHPPVPIKFGQYSPLLTPPDLYYQSIEAFYEARGYVTYLDQPNNQVTAWYDRQYYGSTTTATQVLSGKFPVYFSEDPLINSYSTVQFDGVDDFLASEGREYAANTIVLIVKNEMNPSEHQGSIISCDSSSGGLNGGSNETISIRGTSNANNICSDNATKITIDGVEQNLADYLNPAKGVPLPNDGKYHLIEHVWDGSTVGLKKWLIGCNNVPGAGTYFKGKIALFLIYSGIDDAARRQTRGFYKYTYGLDSVNYIPEGGL